MIPDIRTPEAILREYLAQGEGAKASMAKDASSALDVSLTTFCDVVDRQVFELLLAALADPAVVGAEDGWMFINVIDQQWSLFDVAQRAAIGSTLVTAFERHASDTARFITSEILGSRFGDEKALQLLIGLSSSSTTCVRAAACHGLELLARGAPNSELSRLAIQRLRELSEDGDESVRAEATVSLNNSGLPPFRD